MRTEKVHENESPTTFSPSQKGEIREGWGQDKSMTRGKGTSSFKLQMDRSPVRFIRKNSHAYAAEDSRCQLC